MHLKRLRPARVKQLFYAPNGYPRTDVFCARGALIRRVVHYIENSGFLVNVGNGHAPPPSSESYIEMVTDMAIGIARTIVANCPIPECDCSFVR